MRALLTRVNDLSWTMMRRGLCSNQILAKVHTLFNQLAYTMRVYSLTIHRSVFLGHV